MNVDELTAKFQNYCMQIGYGEVAKAKAHRQINEVEKQQARLIEDAMAIDDRIPAAREAEAKERGAT